MNTIELTRGYTAIVDDCDFEYLSGFTWYAQVIGKKIYAARRPVSGMIYLHREIFRLEKGDKREVDHINGNTLDNRRENIRLCSHAENNRNKGKQSNNKSGFKGVSFHQRNKKWTAWIAINREHIYLGIFGTAEEAHKAYCLAAENHHGEFARI